jgi:hypothetical protein
MSEDVKERPDGYDEFAEVNREVDLQIPTGAKTPDQICVIALEVQFRNDEDTEEAPGERKLFIRGLAEEIHARLIKLGNGWQRHSISYRSLELQDEDGTGDEETETLRGAIDEATIAKKPTILH